MYDDVALPESLKRLIRIWQTEGASRAEIIARLDELELLAQEERAKLIDFVSTLAQ